MTATSQIKVRLILTDTAPEVTPGDVSALDGATNPDQRPAGSIHTIRPYFLRDCFPRG